MATQRTLCIIKPDSVEQNKIGAILSMIEDSGLNIRSLKMLRLARPQAETFYQVHAERSFFGELVEFMTRGPIVVACLEGEDAINRYRSLMGATDPEKAEDGTIRKLYGTHVGENAVHGSDSPETARFEVNYFFPGFELGH
jgi:nucleoside-diphosphate kinase